MPALDVLEIAKPILLQRYQEAIAEKTLIAKREKEFLEARRREEEARILADRTAKNQEEARKQRILEMQRLDLQKSFSNNTLLDKSNSGDSITVTTPVITPIPAPIPIPSVAPLMPSLKPSSSPKALSIYIHATYIIIWSTSPSI